jgi:hypothetical protein
MLCLCGVAAGLYNHHQTGNLDLVAPYVALIFLDYFLRAVRLFVRAAGFGAGDATVARAVTIDAGAGGTEGGGAISIELLMKRRTEIEAGQYFFLCVPSVSVCQWHPFSVVGSHDSNDGAGTVVEIAVKGLGGWSNALVGAGAAGLTGRRVLMDGPFGELAVRPEVTSQAISALLVVSGSFSDRVVITLNYSGTRTQQYSAPALDARHFLACSMSCSTRMTRGGLSARAFTSSGRCARSLCSCTTYPCYSGQQTKAHTSRCTLREGRRWTTAKTRPALTVGRTSVRSESTQGALTSQHTSKRWLMTTRPPLGLEAAREAPMLAALSSHVAQLGLCSQ